jgi:hypothetical protein
MNKCLHASAALSLLAYLTGTATSTFCQVATPSYRPEISVAKNINPAIAAERLKSQVNTVYNEFGPLPTKDGRTLYFSRQGFPGNIGGIDDEDIWYSEFDEETQSWREAINIGAPLNNSGPNFITGIGRTGDTLLLANVYRKNGKMTTGVSVSVRVADNWSFPVPVNIEADYNLARRAGYDVSHDRKVMVISQHKVETEGNLDLYVTFRNENRKQQYSGTESINLGHAVNTPADEISPWLAYDGITLYFASDGHNGFGRMDIFKSVRLDDTWTNWSVPENLGPGINSAYDDVSFNFNPLSRYAYFSRGLSTQNSDIFTIDMTRLFLPQETAYQSDLKSILKPAEIGETRVVANVFKKNESAINKESLVELEGILTFLNKHKSIELLVSAHAPAQETRSASQALSTGRARSVVEFLIGRGIEKKRLSYQGFGHDIVITNTAASTGQNPIAASVEFRVIKY